MSAEPRWVAFIRGADRTGTLTAVAGVFSTRGVSFASLSTGGVEGETGMIVVEFTASERRQRLLLRTVERLSVVRSVDVRAADDRSVRAAAVMRLADTSVLTTLPGLDVRWSGDPRSGLPVLLEGPLADVEVAVEHAFSAGATAVATVILPPTVTDGAER